MRAIGFSTGAVAKGDFREGLELSARVGTTRAIELSALRERELFALIEAAPDLDLSRYEYISFHAPSVLRELDERVVINALASLPEAWPIIAHPEILTTDAWRDLGSRLCIENMDNRKTLGRTAAELGLLFERFPDAGFCLDVGHARQIDPTMNVAVTMLRTYGERLRQLHVSEVGPGGEHLPLSRLAQISFARVTRFLPEEGCPIIIESVVPEERMTPELEVVSRVFDRAQAEQLREHAFA